MLCFMHTLRSAHHLRCHAMLLRLQVRLRRPFGRLQGPLGINSPEISRIHSTGLLFAMFPLPHIAPGRTACVALHSPYSDKGRGFGLLVGGKVDAHDQVDTYISESRRPLPCLCLLRPTAGRMQAPSGQLSTLTGEQWYTSQGSAKPKTPTHPMPKSGRMRAASYSPA